MRRAIKDPNSSILAEGLQYIPNSSSSNKILTKKLLAEQKGFCAYTDEHISRTDAKDIDHFNPSLKNTPADNYYNWFVAKHQWNLEKSQKWQNYQPILNPTAKDFEQRIVYNTGDYLAHENDAEAQNLIRLLKLDDPILAEKRKKYIKRKREEISLYNETPVSFFRALLGEDVCLISYPRAIREEFGVDI